MRKGFLTVLLAMAMAFGLAMNAAAIDNIAEPSVGFVVPWVYGNNTEGIDTVIGIQDTPADYLVGSDNLRPVVWTFFRAADSAHILDKDFALTPGEVFLFSWNAVKGFNLDGVNGYLVFADPYLETTTLTANALQIRGYDAAAYIPVLQLRGGYIWDGLELFSLDGWNCADQDIVDTYWRDYSVANAGQTDPLAVYSGQIYDYRDEIFVNSVPEPPYQVAEIVDNGGDLQIFVSPNTAWNGIQPGQTVIPRVTGGEGSVLDTTIAIWKPDTEVVGGTVNFWDTSTEQNVSLTFGSDNELVLLWPYDTTILGNPNFNEGAVQFTNWPTPGGIVFSFVSANESGQFVTEIQTLIAAHYYPYSYSILTAE